MPKAFTVIMKDEVDEIAETFPAYRGAGSLGETAAAGQVGIDSYREYLAYRILKSRWVQQSKWKIFDLRLLTQ